MMELEYELTREDYAIAKDHGITYKQAYERFYHLGWSKKKATTRPLGRNALWPKYKELCEQNGIAQPTFYKRVQKGMDHLEAATLAPSKKNRLFKDVKITHDMIEQAKANGIKPNTFMYRVYKCRWSVERAMTTPVETKYARKTKVAQ